MIETTNVGHTYVFDKGMSTRRPMQSTIKRIFNLHIVGLFCWASVVGSKTGNKS